MSDDALRELDHDHVGMGRLVGDLREAAEAVKDGRLPIADAHMRFSDGLGELREEIFHHFAREEEGLFPLVVRELPDLADEVDLIARAHDGICGAVARLGHLADQGPEAFGAQLPAVLSLFERFDRSFVAHSEGERAFIARVAGRLDERQRAELSTLLRGLLQVIVGDPVPPALARSEVLDAAGNASALGAHWARSPCLVVFLRHFGCSACSEHVTELAPRLGELARLGVSAVFVGNGAPSFVSGFVERHGLDRLPVEVVTDPTLQAFEAAGLVRSLWSLAGPRAVAFKLRGLAAGHVQDRVEGDLRQQGGVLVVDREARVAYRWRDRSLGDHAPMGDVVDAAMRVALAGVLFA